MAKTMWRRCPECNTWCNAEKKGNLISRVFNSIKRGDKDAVDLGGYYGDQIGLKGVGKAVGRGINAINYIKHLGEGISGDKFTFICSNCSYEFGYDNEDLDLSAEHDLWVEAHKLAQQYSDVNESNQQSFIFEVEKKLAQVSNAENISDAEAVLHDTLGCCYYFFEHNPNKALIEINRSLELFDDPKSHILKGIFMGNVSDPVNSYSKMNELLNLKETTGDLIYVQRNTALQELELTEKNYEGKLLDIPYYQRKFLVITSDYYYLPESFKVLRYNNVGLSNIKFPNGVPNNNAIYIGHPYKNNLYLPSESYQAELFKDQLNELRELLQCLGAKSISLENNHSLDSSAEHESEINVGINGGYKGMEWSASASSKFSNSVMKTLLHSELTEDDFAFNPDLKPFVPEGLVWYEHMEEWQRLVRMRLRGQQRYSFSLNSKATDIVNQYEANQVNADFKALVAKGGIEVSQSEELKAAVTISKEVKLVVDFYPLSDYNKSSRNFIHSAETKEGSNVSANKKSVYYVIIGLLAVIAVLLVFLIK